MEHQSAIAYGNKYKSGYDGYDFSRIGLDFDYIIIHETAHEWWGNEVSCADLADMWIHESFGTYTESIYAECMYGYDTALAYINAKRSTVGNKNTIVGKYGVNEEGDGDMYNKGMLFLHTLRHVVNDDPKWWAIIKGMCDTTFKFKNIGYDDVVKYFNERTGMDLTAVFDQYLRHPKIPTLVYSLKKEDSKGNYTLKYKWQADNDHFAMPFLVTVAGKQDKQLKATVEWTTTTIHMDDARVFKIRDDLGYFNTRRFF
jgi:aminopeptidase N